MLLLAMLLGVGAGAGCGVLVGSAGPVEEKARDYSVSDLSKQGAGEWVRLSEGTGADEAFQSTRTSAVIAVSSSCPAGGPRASSPGPSRLRQEADEMLLGLTDVRQRQERTLVVAGAPALEVTVVGALRTDPRGASEPEPAAIHLVVIERQGCSYQLMSASTPEAAEETERAFSRLVASFSFERG